MKSSSISPHSGYHWRGQGFSANRFFEGWYLRLTLPDVAQTFAFMYSIDDPAGGTDHSGGAAQILGPDESYYCRSFADVNQFWAWPHQLGLGHWRSAKNGARSRYLNAADFAQVVSEGYQVTSHHHQGKLLLPSGHTKAEWDYCIAPVYGWGGDWGSARHKATAGWLSYLPVFEPGWQVLMAHGLASGWIYWQGKRYTFDRAPAYAEKNWGGAFPVKWFWLQCNAFADAPDLSITAVGGVRDVLTWQEDVGLIGIHYQGEFYEFLSTTSSFSWTVSPWGHWHLSANNYRYRIEITGRAVDEGAWVRVPTHEGLRWLCRDTTHGEMQLRLWQRAGRNEETVILAATSQLAGLEVGGGPWDEAWVVEKST
ncbi:MAG: tocopherol cyclase family protein [Phormidesmis sp.]